MGLNCLQTFQKRNHEKTHNLNILLNYTMKHLGSKHTMLEKCHNNYYLRLVIEHFHMAGCPSQCANEGNHRSPMSLYDVIKHPCYGLFSMTNWLSEYLKGKTILDFNDARDDGVMGCSGISWTICKQYAPRSRQITTPTLHNPIFMGPMLFMTLNQPCQSTESNISLMSLPQDKSMKCIKLLDMII